MVIMLIQFNACKLLGTLFITDDKEMLNKLLCKVPDCHIIMVTGLHLQLTYHLEFKELVHA